MRSPRLESRVIDVRGENVDAGSTSLPDINQMSQRTMEILVPKLNDMKSAAVDIEVYVALLELRGDGLPNIDFWMHLLYGLP